MSLISLVPKLVEKTQSGKITWTKGPLAEFHYVSSMLENSTLGLKHIISVEQVSTVNESNPESSYYIKLFDAKEQMPVLEFMEKVEITKISALLKEVRNQVMNKNYSSRLEQLKNHLDSI
jgi:hypothetical protein